MPRPPLLILGASGRAAASSAFRAGFAPTVVDLFADRDLSARFPARRVDRADYPDGIEAIAATLPPGPWITAGALENHPDLVDRIARSRPLIGIGGDALRAVRDPGRWTRALREAGLPTLDCRTAADPPPTSGRWLVKPLASAAGRGIRPWSPGEAPIPPGSLLQRRASGVSMGATFVGDGRSRATLIGVTRQLLGANGAGLIVAYRGSVGPVSGDLPPAATVRIAAIGAELVRAFGLAGPFGVDFVLDGGVPYPVEINPRYTASVEVLERAGGRQVFRSLDDDRRPTGPTVVVAKRILFARRPARAPVDWPWTDPTDPNPEVADLPAPGVSLASGDPVLTVFAEGRSVAGAMAGLARRARAWRRRIDAWPCP